MTTRYPNILNAYCPATDPCDCAAIQDARIAADEGKSLSDDLFDALDHLERILGRELTENGELVRGIISEHNIDMAERMVKDAWDSLKKE